MTPSDPNTPNHKGLPVPVRPLGTADSQQLATSALLGSLLQYGGDGAPSGAAALSATPTLSGLVQALRRRWLLAVGVAAVAAVAAAGAVFVVMPPRYVAEARFKVSAHPDVAVMGPNAADPTEFIYVKEYQKALVKSPLVLAAALNEDVAGNRKARDLAIARANGADASDWLERSLKADFKVAPEIMSVWLSGDDPAEVAELLNAVGRAYVKENEEKEKVIRDQRLKQFRENLAKKETELFNFRADRDNRRRGQQTPDRQTNAQKLQQAMLDLAQLKTALANLRAKREEAQVEQSDLEGAIQRLTDRPIPEEKVDEYLKNDPVAGVLYKLIADGEAEITFLRSTYTPEFAEPKVAQEQESIRGLAQKLAQVRRQRLPELEVRYREKVRLELTEKIEAAKRKVRVYESQEQAAQKDIATAGDLVNRLAPASQSEPLDIAALNDKIDSAQKAIQTIQSTIHLLSVETARPLVTLQSRAVPPTDRDISRQTKLAGAGGFGMFGLTLFGVALFEFRSRRISGADEVAQGLGMNVVGTVPAIPTQARQPIGAPAGADTLWQHQLHESVDAIRTLLLHASRSEALRVVMVTSANSAEGKTSLASQLAASLARAWRKVLLVDGDLRHPAAHDLFGVAPEPGFSEVLRGEVAAEDAIRATQMSRLWVLPAGNWDSHAIQALAQDNLRTLFEQLKQQYDFVIVDSCPVLPVADTLLLGQHVDGVIFSILRDVSRAPEVFAAHQKLTALGVRILGAVMLGARPALSNRGYQYAAGKAAAAQ
jgi:capsular exopolysaccharide synthesis family protein